MTGIRTSAAADLAARGAEVCYANLPATTVSRALVVLIDTLAVCRGGTRDPFCASYARSLTRTDGGGPSAVVFGTRHGPELAAYINGLTATVLQADEGHRTARGHPAIHVVPACLAVAEEVNASREQLIEAVVAGYEVATRTALLIGPLRSNLHPHGTWGALGAAVGASKLMGAAHHELHAVVEAVATVPIVPWRGTVTHGSSIHHLYSALGAQLGVLVARAVHSGAGVADGAFEYHYRGELQARRGRDVEKRGPFEIDNGYIKFIAACAHAHTAIQALEEIVRVRQFGSSDIERISVHTYTAAAALTDPKPATNLAARFSIPFLLARSLVRGSLGYDLFTMEDLADRESQRLAERISVAVDPKLDSGYPNVGRPTRVVVHLRDGRRYQRTVLTARGDVNARQSTLEWKAKINALVGAPMAIALTRYADTSWVDWSARDLGNVIIGKDLRR